MSICRRIISYTILEVCADREQDCTAETMNLMINQQGMEVMSAEILQKKSRKKRKIYDMHFYIYEGCYM